MNVGHNVQAQTYSVPIQLAIRSFSKPPAGKSSAMESHLDPVNLRARISAQLTTEPQHDFIPAETPFQE